MGPTFFVSVFILAKYNVSLIQERCVGEAGIFTWQESGVKLKELQAYKNFHMISCYRCVGDFK